MSKLIVVEGGDQRGKETQSKLIVQWLRDMGYRAERVEIPYRDAITHPLIYWFLRSGAVIKHPELFQFLHYVNRRLFQATLLRKLEQDNDFIVLDRWYMSSLVYAKMANVDMECVNAMCIRLRKPDATIVLYGQQFNARADDVYESNLEFQCKVNAEYCRLAVENGVDDAHYYRVCCNNTREHVHQCVKNALSTCPFLLHGVS